MNLKQDCYERRDGAAGTDRISYSLSSVNDTSKAMSELYRKDKEVERSLQPKARISPRLEEKGVEV